MALPSSIRDKTEACQELFTRCLSLPTSDRLDWLETRQGDFNLWKFGIKATSVGRSSLDYRLRDMPDIREMISDLLGGLAEVLQDYLQTAKSPSETHRGAEVGSELEHQSEMTSDWPESSSEGDTTATTGGSDGSFTEQAFSIKVIVGQLARLSTAIRQSGAKYRYQKADASLKEQDFEEFKNHLACLIRTSTLQTAARRSGTEYSFVPEDLDIDLLSTIQKRLIHANVVRRNRILFAVRNARPSEMQAAPKANPPRFPDPEAKPIRQITQKPLQTISDDPTVPLPSTAIKPPSTIESATDIDSQINLDALNLNTTTPSIMSRPTRTGAMQDYPKCPSRPPGELLRCPYCADLLPVEYSSNQSRWRGHVAQDILPYSCIYELCEVPDRMYLTSTDLLNHMHSRHSVIRWVCDYCSPKHPQLFVFKSLLEWEDHMHKMHPTALVSFKPSSLAGVSERKRLEEFCCPLCAYATDDLELNISHMTKHLHEFALRCLPWSTNDSNRDTASTILAEGSRSKSFMTDENMDDSKLEYRHLTVTSDIIGSQQSFAKAKQLVSGLTELLATRPAQDTGDPALELLCDKSKALSHFECSTPYKVGIIGDSGVGKSSLLNSLLDFQLARASYSGAACTCVVTEFHYHNSADFVIETEVFGIDEIMAQVTELLSYYRHYHTHAEEMIGDERKDFEKRANVAKDTFGAMFGGRHEWEKLLVRQPEHLVLQTLQSWINDIDYLDFGQKKVRSSVEDCSSLLTRLTTEQASSQELAVWPYIQKIRVFLKASVLSQGLVLTDLPGFHDINSARQDITERYLLECDQIFAVSYIGRAISNAGLRDVIKLAKQANLSNTTIICTKSDDIQADEARKDRDAKTAGDIEQLMDAVNNSVVELKKLDDQLKQLEEFTDEEETDHQWRSLSRSLRRARQQKSDHEFKLKQYLVKTRNANVTRKLLSLYENEVPENTLKVFCVSNTDYWTYRSSNQDNERWLDLSGVIEFRAYCMALGAASRLRVATRYIHDDIPAFLSEIVLWVQSKRHMSSEQKEIVHRTLSVLETRLREDLCDIVFRLKNSTAAIKDGFHTQLYESRRVSDWTRAAIEAEQKWSTWHHTTFAAFCRHYGDWSTAAVGWHCWGEEIIEKMSKDLSAPWQRLRIMLQNLHESTTKQIEDMLYWGIQHVDTTLKGFPDLAAPLSQALMSRHHLVIEDVRKVCEKFEASISILRTDMFSGIRTSLIGKAMESSYASCNLESGRGYSNRQKMIIHSALNRESLFEGLMEEFRARFINMTGNLQRDLQTVIEMHLDILQGTLDTMQGKGIASESEHDLNFQMRLEEEVEAMQGNIQQLQITISA